MAGLGNFFAGAAQEGTKDIESQENRAFQMKLQSAQIQQQAQAQQALRAQEIAGSAAAAQATYERGLLPNGTAEGLGKTTGVSFNGVSSSSLPGIADVLKSKFNPEFLNLPGETKVQLDANGIPMLAHHYNLMGNEKDTQTVPHYDESVKSYTQNAQYMHVVQLAHQLYQGLSAHNMYGAGHLINAVPQDLAPVRNELIKTMQELGPLEAENEGGVPGGRYVQALGASLMGSVVAPEMNPTMEKDLYNNTLLRGYERMSQYGKINTAPDGQALNGVRMPSIFETKFGGVVQHDKNGQPQGLGNYTVLNGDIYGADKKSALASISDDDSVPTKPAINHRFLNNTITTAVQKGSQQADPFQGIDWSK